ncbi:MAG: hypothetical protein Tsb0034_21770 [Ekhidna sp.]
MNYLLDWTPLRSNEHLDQIISDSTTKPALIFKHRASSDESNQIKRRIEDEWDIPSDQLECYILDVMRDKNVAYEVSEIAGVPNEFPQVLLFADGVTMYDESHEMINVKKIKLALKIINRTFRWMETRA